MAKRIRLKRLSGGMKRMLRQQSLQGRRKTLCRMQHGRCRYCRTRTPWEEGTVDHRVPTSKGGTDEMDNLVFACEPCNLEKRSMSEQEYVALRREREKAMAD